MTLPPLPPVRRAILGLIALAFVFFLAAGYATRGGDPSLEVNAPPSLPNTAGLVDQKPLQTARLLASQAATAPERQYAQQAMQIADNEVDQAFATALREAAMDTTPLTGEALQISQKIAALNQRIRTEQDRVHALTAALPKASDQQDARQTIDLAQAELDLDNDALNDLRQDLVRVGGDKHARIQQALDEHQAVEKQAGSIPENTLTGQMETPAALRTLPGKFRAYFSLRQRAATLRQARAEAIAAAAQLDAQHNALDAHAEASTPAGGANPAGDTGDRAAAISSLHRLSKERQSLAQLDQRIHDEQQLAEVYQRWEALAVAQRWTILHRIFRVFAVILFLVGGIFLGDALIRRVFDHKFADRRRLHTLRLVLTLSVQLVGLLLIVLVVFGTPQQMPTIIGLATAGLTVVLKDFIVAFFGWFVLMGRNGMRVGDWVEINGVSGEVVEIGVLRTVLLETGNWTENGHPTGRRVTFMNSFAIEGQYFNFTTAGQWLWDELRITVPPGPDSYHKVEAIRQIVLEKTAGDAGKAEQDWSRAMRNYSTRNFTAAPSVDLRPASDGIQVIVRYITRAQDRYDVRSALYEKSIGLLHFGMEANSAGKEANATGKEANCAGREANAVGMEEPAATAK